MGTTAQKKKLFDGLSPANAKKKITEIWKEAGATVTFNRANKEFRKAHPMGLLALCETWHRLRSQNKSIEAMITAFAQTIARKNAQNHELSETIHTQRTRLAQLEKMVTGKCPTCNSPTTSVRYYIRTRPPASVKEPYTTENSKPCNNDAFHGQTAGG